MLFLIRSSKLLILNYHKRHNKFLLPSLVKAIYESFYKAENEVFNIVNYSRHPPSALPPDISPQAESHHHPRRKPDDG